MWKSTPEALTKVARATLRQMFLDAEIGISGANLGVAETGSIVLVTNEGNGRMVTSLPPVHIAVMGIERLAPDWQSASVWLSLLARSATGQALSIYTSVVTGPARSDDLDGPQEMHIILLDNNRSAMMDTQYEEMLECIRCGACLSVCPVYKESGGHAYHSPYSGPVGAVVTPLLFGLEEYSGLPQASTLCGACLEVCPVRIDLPRMLLALRVDSVEQGLVNAPTVAAEKVSARMMSRPGWFRFFFGMGRFGQMMMKLFNISFNGFEKYPMVARRSFREIWTRRWRQTMTARDEILKRVKGTPTDLPEMKTRTRHYDDLGEQFAAALARSKGETFLVESREAAIEKLGELLAEMDIENVVAHRESPLADLGIPDAFPGLALAFAGETDDYRAICARADLGLTSAEYAFAETGSLVIVSGPDKARMTTPAAPGAYRPAARIAHPAQASSSGWKNARIHSPPTWCWSAVPARPPTSSRP